MTTTRDKQVREVAKRGVDGVGELCAGLSADTLEATLRWYDGKDDATPNLLAWKLKEGGVYVPDEEAETPGTVWKQENRLAWIERYMPEEMEKDDGYCAEVAIVGLVRAGLSVSVVKVREYMAGVESISPGDPAKRFKLKRQPQPKRGQPQPIGDVIREEAA